MGISEYELWLRTSCKRDEISKDLRNKIVLKVLQSKNTVIYRGFRNTFGSWQPYWTMADDIIYKSDVIFFSLGKYNLKFQSYCKLWIVYDDHHVYWVNTLFQYWTKMAAAKLWLTMTVHFRILFLLSNVLIGNVCVVYLTFLLWCFAGLPRS